MILKTKEEPRLHIDWDINYNCNYRCSYCESYETGWNKTSFEKAIVALDNLQGSVLKHTTLPTTIWFSGGEPSILSWFSDFCLYTKGINPQIKLCMTSNGSQPSSYYSDLLHNNLLDYINFSLHFEFAKPSHFLTKIYSLVETHGVDKLSVVVMYEKQATEQATSILDELKAKNIKSSTHLIRGEDYENTKDTENFVLKKYTSNLLDVEIDGKYYNSNYILDSMYKNKYSFKNWKCWAGVHHFYISKDFDLLAASCLIKYFGNLLKDDIIFDNSPIICDGRSCICNANVKIRKEYTI